MLDLIDDGTRKLTPTEILVVAKREDGKDFWLEEGFQKGKNGFGWIHIKKEHITGEVPGKTLFPGSMTEDDVKDLIFETLRNPCVSEISTNGNSLYYHDMVPPNGKYIRVITNSHGGIVSAYMVNKLPVV